MATWNQGGEKEGEEEEGGEDEASRMSWEEEREQ